MQQASVMAGIEGERPQNKEGGQPQRAFMGGERYERSKKHYGGIATSELRLRNGQPKDIGHLYTERDQDGQLIWWTERQSIASWQEEVRAAHERGDPRYENIPEDQIPASITHSRASIYQSGDKRVYAGNNYAFIEYVSSSDQHDSFNTVQVLNEPVTIAGRHAEAGKGAEPKRDRAKGEQEQEDATAGRGKNAFYEDVQQRRSEEHSGDESHQNFGQGEQRNRQSQGDANTADTQERGDLYADIGLTSAEFKARVADVRKLLRVERQRYGEGFNEAEFLREKIDQGIRHLVDEDFDREDDLIELYEDLYKGWDVMTFSRYSTQTQRMALEQEEYLQRVLKRGVLVRKKAVAMLDIMATAIDLPHVPGQQVDNRQADIMSIFGVEQKERDHWIKPH